MVTHKGVSHMDDLLCALVALAHGLTVVRSERINPTDLADKSVLICDCGGKYEPELGNYDHHGVEGAEGRCAFELLIEGEFPHLVEPIQDELKALSAYDCYGPAKGLQVFNASLELPRGVKTPRSLLEHALLGWFSQQSVIIPEEGGWFVEFAQEVFWPDLKGRFMESELVTRFAGCAFLEWVKSPVQAFGPFEDCNGKTVPPARIAAKMREMSGGGSDLPIAIVSPSLRGEGFTLFSDRTDVLSFSHLGEEERNLMGISFIHDNGFLCVFDNAENATAIVQIAHAKGLHKKGGWVNE
jgi:hypothetical protein